LIARSALAVAITLALAAGLPAPSRAAAVTITILDAFDPAAVTVTPGTTVTWVNESGNRHRVRTTSGPAEFDSGNLEPGQQFSITLNALGTYDYRDERNPDDRAFWAKIVVAKNAATPTPTPTPGGGTPAPTPKPTPPPATGDVGMAGRVFRPATITIAPGGSVTWTNDDGRDHTVTANDSSFDSGTLAPGRTYKRTFPTAGTYAYLCSFHPDMTGKVVVTAPGSTPPPPTPAPKPTPTPVPTPATTPTPGAIRAVDYAFQPTSLTVKAGTRVAFVNAGKAPHTLTAKDGSFDSGIVAAGGRWSHTFSTPGTFGFLCSVHPEMVGTLRVTDATGSAPPPAPTSKPTPTPPGGSGGGAPGAFSIRDFSFEPSAIRVATGTTVRWVNRGAAPHTVTDKGGSFDSGFINGGESWSHTFRQAGTFSIWCVIHPQMVGTVTVTGAGSGAGGSGSSADPGAPGASPSGSPIPVAIGGTGASPATPGDGTAAGGTNGGGTGGSTAGGGGTASGGSGSGSGGLPLGTIDGTAPALFSVGELTPGSLAGLAVALLLIGGGAVLFTRTISGAVRRPDEG
jgi:plastocyanin